MLKPPRSPLLLKAAVIGVLALLMMIPLGMIEGLIAERASRRNGGGGQRCRRVSPARRRSPCPSLSGRTSSNGPSKASI
ncbi:MAG: inner membrane CreD family protein [Burkholderiaceae bacterium]|nr:inner membrane CreD family protein [Burkholderiaceae bacterium]